MSTLTSKGLKLESSKPQALDQLARTKIPFNRVCPVGTELEYLCEVLEQRHLSGDGPFTRKCHQILERSMGAGKALLTTSCTHALEMSAILLGIEPGDEVILPSFTFVSTANAFVLRGATPVFVDIRPDTLSLDERRIEQRISSKTKAIVVVHYAGVAGKIDSILDKASRWNIPVVEDNAHGIFGRYRKRNLGTFGSLATLSFHETKNFTCGEGGALLINDPLYVERAEMIREKGTDRTRFLRGEVDKYTWTDVGSSYLPSELLAAVLYAQLEARDTIQARRRQVWQSYYDHLRGWAQDQKVSLPVIPPECEQPHHMFYLLMPSVESRQSLIEHLRGHNVYATFHYLPLHLSQMGRRFGGREGDLPVTESVSKRLLRLPFYNDLSEEEQTRVIQAVREFQVNSRVD